MVFYSHNLINPFIKTQESYLKCPETHKMIMLLFLHHAISFIWCILGHFSGWISGLSGSRKSREMEKNTEG